MKSRIIFCQSGEWSSVLSMPLPAFLLAIFKFCLELVRRASCRRDQQDRTPLALKQDLPLIQATRKIRILLSDLIWASRREWRRLKCLLRSKGMKSAKRTFFRQVLFLQSTCSRIKLSFTAKSSKWIPRTLASQHLFWNRSAPKWRAES